jgi:hypothetical protein
MDAMLVAVAHDRFARGAGDRPGAAQSLGEIWRELRRKNVWLRTVEDDAEMRDEASVAAVGRRAHIDSARKSKAVKKGMRRRARDRGKLSGGPRALGSRWEGPHLQKRLVHVPEEVPVVERIFRDYIAGMSQMALAKALNADGVPTVKGSVWCQASVRRVLANPLYMGWLRHDGEVYRGEHEGIVSEELWREAEARRAATARTKGGGGRWPKGPHLLTKGLLRCGNCGHAMIPRTDPTRRGGHYETYICDGRRRNGPEFCSQLPVDRAPVDEALLGELTRKYIDLDETRARIEARIAADGARAADALAQAEREASAAQERYQRVQRAFQGGVIEAEDWAEQRPGLIAEREAAEAAVARACEHGRELATAAPLLDAEAELLGRLADLRTAVLHGIGDTPNLDALRRLLHNLFSVVYYQPADRDHWSLHLRTSREALVPVGSAFLEPHLRGGGLAHPALYAPKLALQLEQPLRVGLPFPTERSTAPASNAPERAKPVQPPAKVDGVDRLFSCQVPAEKVSR